MDQTVSRRSEPSSRTTLMGEQPNPWNVLPLQDVMNRHRGAKPSRRCELLGKISLFCCVNIDLFIAAFLDFRISTDYVIDLLVTCNTRQVVIALTCILTPRDLRSRG
jgi:hypothetical protein